MNKIYSLFAIAALAVSCSPKAPTTVNGTIIDASTNNICVLTAAGDTVCISTMDADPVAVPGVLIEDSVVVVYKDTTMNDVEVKQAVSLEVLRHSPNYFIQGSWIEPNPINASEVQGFTLNQDGTVTMINMATLVFNAWNLADGSLTLSGQSIGNKETITINETYKVDELNAEKLVLSQNGNVMFNLSRQK